MTTRVAGPEGHIKPANQPNQSIKNYRINRINRIDKLHKNIHLFSRFFGHLALLTYHSVGYILKMRQAKATRSESDTKGYKIMKIYKEENLSDFEFWSGAKDTVNYLTDEEMDTIEGILEELAPDGMGETELNDFFWFEDELIAEWLGYEDFAAIMNR